MKMQKADQQNKTKGKMTTTRKENGDDSMSNVREEYATLNLRALAGKKKKIVSSEEALKDVSPVNWEPEILRGERKVVATKADK